MHVVTHQPGEAVVSDGDVTVTVAGFDRVDLWVPVRR
jgi:hypothetical protein